jgi:hypothetical protein
LVDEIMVIIINLKSPFAKWNYQPFPAVQNFINVFIINRWIFCSINVEKESELLLPYPYLYPTALIEIFQQEEKNPVVFFVDCFNPTQIFLIFERVCKNAVRT